jgi:hypothetical protein
VILRCNIASINCQGSIDFKFWEIKILPVQVLKKIIFNIFLIEIYVKFWTSARTWAQYNLWCLFVQDSSLQFTIIIHVQAKKNETSEEDFVLFKRLSHLHQSVHFITSTSWDFTLFSE